MGKFEGEIRKFFVGNYNFRLENEFYRHCFVDVVNVAVGSDEISAVKFVTDVFVAVFCHSPRLNSRAVVDRRSDCAVGKLKNIQHVPVFTVVGYSYVDCFIVVACVNIVDPTGVVVAGVVAVIGDSPNVVAQCFVGFGKGNVIRFANRLSNKGNGAVCIGDIVNVEVSAKVVVVDGQFVVQRDVVHVVEVQRKHYGVCIAVAVVACKLTVGKRPCVCGSGSACNGVEHVVGVLFACCGSYFFRFGFHGFCPFVGVDDGTRRCCGTSRFVRGRCRGKRETFIHANGTPTSVTEHNELVNFAVGVYCVGFVCHGIVGRRFLIYNKVCLVCAVKIHLELVGRPSVGYFPIDAVGDRYLLSVANNEVCLRGRTCVAACVTERSVLHRPRIGTDVAVVDGIVARSQLIPHGNGVQSDFLCTCAGLYAQGQCGRNLRQSHVSVAVGSHTVDRKRRSFGRNSVECDSDVFRTVGNVNRGAAHRQKFVIFFNGIAFHREGVIHASAGKQIVVRYKYSVKVNVSNGLFETVANGKFHDFSVGVGVFHGNAANGNNCVDFNVKFYFDVLHVFCDAKRTFVGVDVGKFVNAVHKEGFFQQNSVVRGVAREVTGTAEKP